jgi:hypothetical protein
MDIKAGDVITYYTLASNELHGIVKEVAEDKEHFNVFWIDKKGMKSGLPSTLSIIGLDKWWFKVDD